MNKRELIQQIENTITKLDGITAIPHPRFGGRQFEWNGKEIGHIHWYGDLDILFKKDIHDALIKEGTAEDHKWVPGSGWITFLISEEAHIHPAMELLKLSYYQKRKRAEKEKDFTKEIEGLELSDKIKALI
jgi:Family of unknown function (DUF5519)